MFRMIDIQIRYLLKCIKVVTYIGLYTKLCSCPTTKRDTAILNPWYICTQKDRSDGSGDDDDPFYDKDRAEHNKMVAIAKTFEEKYVSCMDFPLKW